MKLLATLLLACSLLTPGNAQSAQPSEQPAHSQTSQTDPSKSRYYTNRNGQRVKSPVQVQAQSAPAGATAQCRDGSWSFSRHRQGTCSHHGGVAKWLVQ